MKAFESTLYSQEAIMSSLGTLDRLPLELREQIYGTLYQTAFVHCCCRPHKHNAIETDQGKDADFRLKSGHECVNTDIEPILKRGTWAARTLTLEGRHPSPWNPFTFLQTSKTIWTEAEKIAWQSLTISVGVPQFKALHSVQLSRPVRSLGAATRCELLRNLHLSLPDTDTLAENIGRSSMSHGLSGYFLVTENCTASLKILAKYVGLARLTLTIPPPCHTMRREFRAFWPALVYYTPVIAEFKVFIANSANTAFVLGNKAYLAAIEGDDEEKVPHRVLSAMLLAAEKTLTADDGLVLPPAPDVLDMNNAQTFCWEAIEYADVPVDTVCMRTFRSLACAYLGDGSMSDD